MRMQFGTSAFERARGDLPTVPLLNMIVEQVPTEETGIALQSRPGLVDRGVTVGDNVTGIFRADGVLSGKEYAVSGGYLYEDGVVVGAIDGDGAVSMAGNELGLMLTAGAALWFFDGATLSAVTFPDSANVLKVFAGASRFWAIRADTGKIYWTPALGTTFGGLDFATAESVPDRLLDGLWMDNTAVLFGAASVEFWFGGTGDPPITPLPARVFSSGVRATGCATQWGETYAWVGSDSVVYVNGDEPQAISTPGMQALIEASTECALWTFVLEGQDFLALRIDGRTLVRGSRNGSWSEFTSYGESNWLPRCYADGIFGCPNGVTARWGGYADFDGVIDHTFRGGFPVNAGGVIVSNILLRCNTGQTSYLTGDYVDPVIEMRLSRDLGKTWGPWRARKLGAQGEYLRRISWRACGMASAPGLLAEFRTTAPLDFRVSDVLMNEAIGGR